MTKTQILQQFAFQRQYLSLLIDDVSDEQMCAQPAGMPNHPAWHIGHLAWVVDNMVKLLGGTPVVDEGWVKKFKQGSIPTASRAEYPSKKELLQKLDERRGVFAAALESATAEQLNQPNPAKPFPNAPATLEGMIFFLMAFHEGTHLGQIASWRKAMNMEPALAKLGK